MNAPAFVTRMLIALASTAILAPPAPAQQARRLKVFISVDMEGLAGLYGVPVVFVAGDRAVVDQLRGLLGPIDGVAVKEEIGGRASLGLSPKRAQDDIRQTVERAIRNRARAKLYKLPGPYTMVLKV